MISSLDVNYSRYKANHKEIEVVENTDDGVRLNYDLIEKQIADRRNSIAEDAKANTPVVDENVIRDVISKMTGIPVSRLAGEEAQKLLHLGDEIKQRIIDNVQLGDYVGPFGIDMMIVNSHLSPLTSHLLLHPCVELNLRRTMGHVALSITPPDNDYRKVMRIELTDHYKLSVHLLR